MPLFIDSHAHLDFDSFGEDREAVIARAKATGLVHVVVIGQWAFSGADAARGDGLQGARAALSLAKSDRAFLSATAGIHPHDAASAPDEDFRALKDLCAAPDIVAVGECGLDYHYDHSPRDVQRARFIEQLELAKVLQKPIVVHTREADADTLAILKDHLGPASGVIHCFTSNPAAARAYLDLGLSISFSGVVTFKNAEPVREAARLVPLDRMLVETDAPFLSPIPFRGKRNEPAFVQLTAQRLAEVKGISLDALATATTANARRVLRLP